MMMLGRVLPLGLAWAGWIVALGFGDEVSLGLSHGVGVLPAERLCGLFQFSASWASEKSRERDRDERSWISSEMRNAHTDLSSVQYFSRRKRRGGVGPLSQSGAQNASQTKK